VTLPKKSFSWKRAPILDRRPVLRLVAGSRRWDVRLVGMVSRVRFLVSHPMDDGKLIFVKEGERFDVANFDGAVVSAFESTVLRVLLGDAPGLELSLPALENRKREVIRKARRVQVMLPCSLRYGTGADQLRTGVVGDLSDMGAQVALEHPLPETATHLDLSLRITMLGEPLAMQVRALVRSSAPDPRPDSPATLLGLQFLEVEPSVRLALSHFVAERLLAQSDDVFGVVR